MKRSRRITWWCVYAAGSVAVVGALAWTTHRVLHLEHEEAQARASLRRQEIVRQALWRMDSWLAPRIARESARTWFEYEAYFPQTMAFNRLLEPLSEGAVVLPSPLLNFRSESMPLHFQYSVGSGFTSPQVPSAKYESNGVVGCSPVPADPALSAALTVFAKSTDPNELRRKLQSAELALAKSLAEDVPAQVTVVNAQTAEPQTTQQAAPFQGRRALQQELNDNDLRSRKGNLVQAQQQVMEESKQEQTWRNAVNAKEAEAVQVGPLVPVWLGDPPDRLVLVRSVRTGKETLLQGVLVDWKALQHSLLQRVQDVMPGAALRPVAGAAVGDAAVALATIPAELVVPAGVGDDPADTANAGLMGLGVVWLAALGALGTTGLALRSSIANAVQTSRFASSVTHELRTPLTTFRLYAEMLADGMVPDPQKRAEYLDTLRDESARLGFLVENVLTWSRVEEGRATVEPRRMSAAELVMAAEPVLQRRCHEAGATFKLALATDPIHTSADADRVRQVLFNLVDNACKYAGNGATIQLSSTLHGSSLVLAVDDNGPGVPSHLQRRVFQAFDRGDRGPGDAVRGLGLGLAISRELARSLGGELICTQSPLGGARFELQLPVLL